MVVSMLNISVEEKQHILEQFDINKRLSETSVILHREMQKAKIGEKIMTDVKDSINKNQREYYLREQMKAIRKELGEDEGRTHYGPEKETGRSAAPGRGQRSRRPGT
ncbi:MAG: hypothetical protein U5N26_07850 [Candidatus Marinimicrobia bacterium]|nr:hypothetical protein [Candidatus Neomarinimicrobiota bacterium]